MITLSPKYSQLRALNESDLLQVLEWRNHDSIRQWMTNTDIITFENHCNWFKKSNTDKNKLFYYRGLKEFQNKTEKGYLIDTCLNSQDKYINMIEYYLK